MSQFNDLNHVPMQLHEVTVRDAITTETTENFVIMYAPPSSQTEVMRLINGNKCINIC